MLTRRPIEVLMMIASLFWSIEANAISWPGKLTRFGLDADIQMPERKLTSELKTRVQIERHPYQPKNILVNPLVVRPKAAQAVTQGFTKKKAAIRYSYFQAPESVYQGRALSSAFRELPMYSPTGAVLVRFGK
jgi:hypothetical protein